MPDQSLPADRRSAAAHQEVLAAIEEIRGQIVDLATKVAGLIRWQEEQAQEDFERRTREQREQLRTEWEAEQAAKIDMTTKQLQAKAAEVAEEAREARNHLLDRLLLFFTALAALAGWDLVTSWEHGTLASLQTIVAVVIIALTVLLLALGGRL